jgi:uncharacterized protein (TIGR00730 family)
MVKKIQRVAVFCGAFTGDDPEYAKVARHLGIALVEAGIGLVSNAVLQQGGEVIGVIPEMLVKKECVSHRLTNLHMVNSMRERKTLIEKLSDGFIMLPGGVGTLDEFFEAYCLAKLGVHDKPCAILNVANFYDPILQFLEQAKYQGFLNSVSYDMMIVENTPEKLLQRCMAYQSPIKKTEIAIAY